MQATRSWGWGEGCAPGPNPQLLTPWRAPGAGAGARAEPEGQRPLRAGLWRGGATWSHSGRTPDSVDYTYRREPTQRGGAVSLPRGTHDTLLCQASRAQLLPCSLYGHSLSPPLPYLLASFLLISSLNSRGRDTIYRPTLTMAGAGPAADGAGSSDQATRSDDRNRTTPAMTAGPKEVSEKLGSRASQGLCHGTPAS